MKKRKFSNKQYFFTAEEESNRFLERKAHNLESGLTIGLLLLLDDALSGLGGGGGGVRRAMTEGRIFLLLFSSLFLASGKARIELVIK